MNVSYDGVVPVNVMKFALEPPTCEIVFNEISTLPPNLDALLTKRELTLVVRVAWQIVNAAPPPTLSALSK